MPDQQAKKRVGRPRQHLEKQVCLGARIPEGLYARLQAKAAEQLTTMAHITAQALERYLEAQAQAALDLAGIHEGLLAMGEAAAALEGRCNACQTCREHATTTINAAWPKLITALDALSAKGDA